MKIRTQHLLAGLLLAGFNFSSALSAGAQDYTFTTLAGPGNSPGAIDGPGASARFNGPMGVAVDRAGNVYVADWNNATIRKVAPDGRVTTVAGLAGRFGHADGTGGAARFDYPGGVAVDGTGNLYVADTSNDAIRRITPAGVVTTLPGAGIHWPYSVAVDSQGNLYVGSPSGVYKVTGGSATQILGGSKYGVAVDGADNVYAVDAYYSTLTRLSPDGVVTEMGSGFYQPYGVAADNQGNVYVADSGNRVVRKVSPTGVATTLAGLIGDSDYADGTGKGARFGDPFGGALDAAGNLYVSDYANSTIRKVTQGGAVTTLAGVASGTGATDGTGAAARFNYPCGVVADSWGNVYVADTDNHTIRKVSAGGVVSTLAGLRGSYGSGDGPGNVARFSNPGGVAVDSAGNVYVADSGNSTIRTVSPEGMVATLAGAPGSAAYADGTNGQARFNNPKAVVLDGAGNLLVADYGNNAVRRVSPAGVVTTVALGLPGPCGISVDRAGNVYVAEGPSQSVQVVAPDGTITTVWPASGYPTGLAVDPAGNLFVADRSDAIWQVAPGGIPVQIAGMMNSTGCADGTGAAARFFSPGGAAVDGHGTVYVADSYNHAIRLGTATCPDAPVIDQAVGPIGQVRQLSTSPQTAFAWQWRVIRCPAGSSASLSAADVANPTFIPDVADVFVFQLLAATTNGMRSLQTLTFTATPGPPVIVAPPATQTVEIGSAANFNVLISASSPGTAYQWYFDATNVLDGATNASLSLTNLHTAQAGGYSVVVGNAYGAATSAAAGLDVIAPVQRTPVPALRLTGDAGSWLHLDGADALARSNSWQALATVALTNSPQLYFDLASPFRSGRYYRVWQTNLPNVRPALSVSLATELTLSGAAGARLRVDYINPVGPTDAWVALDTVTLTNATQTYFDLTSWRAPVRLYRLVPMP